MLSAIADFPVPTDITGAQLWLRFINQVAFSVAVAPVMKPFRELMSPSDGWCFVLTGSRFTLLAESCYTPIKGEALVVTYGLEKCPLYPDGLSQSHCGCGSCPVTLAEDAGDLEASAHASVATLAHISDGINPFSVLTWE